MKAPSAAGSWNFTHGFRKFESAEYQIWNTEVLRNHPTE